MCMLICHEQKITNRNEDFLSDSFKELVSKTIYEFI